MNHLQLREACAAVTPSCTNYQLVTHTTHDANQVPLPAMFDEGDRLPLFSLRQ
jgi:hypothetical protein